MPAVWEAAVWFCLPIIGTLLDGIAMRGRVGGLAFELM